MYVTDSRPQRTGEVRRDLEPTVILSSHDARERNLERSGEMSRFEPSRLVYMPGRVSATACPRTEPHFANRSQLLARMPWQDV